MPTVSQRNFTFRGLIERQECPEVADEEVEVSRHGGVPIPRELLAARLNSATDAQKRNLGISTFAQGGALVGQKVESNFVTFARANMLCGNCTQIENVPMPNSQPYASTPITTQWLSEHQASTSSDISIGSLVFDPKRISGSVQYSNLLRNLSAVDFEVAVCAEIVKAIYLGVDQALLLGTGGAQPLGVFNTPGVQTMSFGGPPTWSKLMSMPQAIKNQNLEVNATVGFALSPDVEFSLRTTQKASGSSAYLFNDDGTIGGYRAGVSTTLNAASANNRVLGISWENLYLAWFGKSVWVTVNPYILSKTGEREIVVHSYVDGGLLRPKAAICSLDAGNQP